MIPREIESVRNFFRHLATAVSNASLYSPHHPQVSRMCALSLVDLKESLGSSQELSLLLIDDEMVANGIRFEAGFYTKRLARTFKSLGIGVMKVLPDATQGEFESLAALLASGAAAGSDTPCMENIRFGKVEVCLAGGGGEALSGEDRADPDLPEIAGEELARLMEIYEEARKKRKLKITGVSEIVAGFIHTFKACADPLLALAPLRSLDEYTFTHSTNVCILNLAQAMALGLEGPLLQEIGVAAMLHDVGKLFIPEEILTKPGRLDEKEWEIVRQHPLKGAQYLLDTPGAPQLAVVTAYEHHMKYDFSGYPATGGVWQQNVCSHMTTISDLFDALRTRRSYRGSVELEDIAGIMLGNAGTELHPFLTRQFLRIMERVLKNDSSGEVPVEPARDEKPSPSALNGA